MFSERWRVAFLAGSLLQATPGPPVSPSPGDNGGGINLLAVLGLILTAAFFFWKEIWQKRRKLEIKASLLWLMPKDHDLGLSLDLRIYNPREPPITLIGGEVELAGENGRQISSIGVPYLIDGVTLAKGQRLSRLMPIPAEAAEVVAVTVWEPQTGFAWRTEGIRGRRLLGRFHRGSFIDRLRERLGKVRRT